MPPKPRTTPQPVSDSSLSLGPPSGPSGSNGARRVKGKRTRTGCLTCRARKVKCDEGPGTCANCERVLLECRWPIVRNVLDERTMAASMAYPKMEPGEPSSGPVRRNRYSACIPCRVARVQWCSQDRPACSRCLETGMTCQYHPERTTSLQSGTTASSTEDSPNDEAELLRRQVFNKHQLEQHIEAYFLHLFTVQGNAFIHRGSLLRDITDGRVSRKLLLAICAVASRFVQSPPGVTEIPQPVSGSELAQGWAAEAKALLLQEDGMSLENIATAVLLAKYDINSGRFSHAFVLAAIANRIALGMRLHLELPPNEDITVTERETRRRLMWACYSLDRMMSTGAPELLLTPASSLHIRLPCEDSHYQMGVSIETPFPALEQEAEGEGLQETYPDVGIFGHHIRLQGARVLALRSSRHRQPNDLPPWDPSSTFAVAERKFAAWRSSLASQFVLEPETIYARHYANQLTALTMLHIWEHTNLAELYRLALPGFEDSLAPTVAATAPPGWIERTREACVAHAQMVARTLRHVLTFVDQECFVFTDNALPICILESVRVRIQHAFLLPPAQKAAELAELTVDTAEMDGVLQRMSRFFKQAQWLGKEMRRMIRRHGLELPGHNSDGESSGAASPAHDPWSRRVRSFRNDAPAAVPSAPAQAFILDPGQAVHHAPLAMDHHRGGLGSGSELLGYVSEPATLNWPGGPPGPPGTHAGHAGHAHAGFSQPPSQQTQPPHHQQQQQQQQQQQPSHDEMSTILGQYDAPLNTGSSGQGFSLAMLSDWMAIGYDPTAPNVAI